MDAVHFMSNKPSSEVLVKFICRCFGLLAFLFGLPLILYTPIFFVASWGIEASDVDVVLFMEHRLATAAFLFPNSLVYTILALHVHWAQFVGRFLILCIVSHLAPPPCLLSVCPYMVILCNSFDKGCHSVLYSSCTLLFRFRRGSCAPADTNLF